MSDGRTRADLRESNQRVCAENTELRADNERLRAALRGAVDAYEQKKPTTLRCTGSFSSGTLEWVNPPTDDRIVAARAALGKGQP